MSVDQRSVLVTGASSGIGRATSEHLASLGYRVFAGVRRIGDAPTPKGDQTIVPVILDVTDQQSVDDAVSSVQTGLGDEKLFGLVNNAGILVGGPMESLPMEEIRNQFEVNFFGMVAVTQAFLPMMRGMSGRIVNISSLSGLVSFELGGPYSASKYAVEAMSDSLREELWPTGIRVCIIEPGVFSTPMFGKIDEGVNELRRILPADSWERFGHKLEKAQTQVNKVGPRAASPTKVARVIAHALSARRPRYRYLVGLDAKFIARMRWMLPDWAFYAIVRLVAP